MNKLIREAKEVNMENRKKVDEAIQKIGFALLSSRNFTVAQKRALEDAVNLLKNIK